MAHLLVLLLFFVPHILSQSNSVQPAPGQFFQVLKAVHDPRGPPEMARFLATHPHDQHGNHFSWTMRNRGPPVYDANGYDQYGIYNMERDQRRRHEGWRMELVDGQWQPTATWECRGRLVDIVGTWKRFFCDCGIFGTSYQFHGCVPQNVPNPTISHNNMG